MSCSEIRPLLEAFALDALDPLTRAQVQKHVESCEACRFRVESLCRVASELPRAVGQASSLRPPPRLKQHLLQAAQAENQAQAVKEAFAPRAETPVPTRARGSWLLPPRLWFISLGAAAVVILALFGWTMSANLRVQEAVSKEQAALRQVDALRRQQELALPVLNSFNAHEIALNPTALAPDAYGKVILEPNKPTIVFLGYNLPPPPLGQRYVLWTTTRGVMQPVGHFAPNANGFAMVAFQADREDPVLKEVFVTRQPASELLPSANRVLEWKSNPNESAGDFSPGSLLPGPTLITPGR